MRTHLADSMRRPCMQRKKLSFGEMMTIGAEMQSLSSVRKAIFLILLMLPASASAQLLPILGGQRAGISSLQFLKIGVGPRATAMGETFVAIANDASALYWNPAGIAQFQENSVLFSHTEWLVGLKHEFAGVVYHLSTSDAIGASVTSLHTEDMAVTTETMPYGTGEYFRFADIAITATYGRRFTEQFSAGMGVRYVQESIAGLSMRALMVDLGTFYWTGLGTSRFAVAVSNFGAEVKPTGTVNLIGDRTYNDFQSFSPPTVFRIGFAFEPYKTETQRVTTAIQLNHPNDNSENVSIGAEYSWTSPIGIMLAGRAGYRFNVDEQNITFGAGASVPVSMLRVGVDYSYANFGRLGDVHRLSLTISF